MIKTLMTAVLGSRYDREVKRLRPVLEQIHAHEERLKGFSESELPAQTPKFRERIVERTGALQRELDEVRAAKHSCADPIERDQLEQRFHELENSWKKELAATLDDLLPEAFATVREACRRLLGTPVSVIGHELIWGHGSVRRPAHRWHRAPPGPHRRNGDR